MTNPKFVELSREQLIEAARRAYHNAVRDLAMAEDALNEAKTRMIVMSEHYEKMKQLPLESEKK